MKKPCQKKTTTSTTPRRRRVLILKQKLSRPINDLTMPNIMTPKIESTFIEKSFEMMKTSTKPSPLKKDGSTKLSAVEDDGSSQTLETSQKIEPTSIKQTFDMQTSTSLEGTTPSPLRGGSTKSQAIYSNSSGGNKRCKNRSQQFCQRSRNRKPKLKKSQPQSVIAASTIETYTDILSRYETLSTTSIETTLRPRTYTYVIDRVHDNQHEVQTSVLVRDHLTTVTHTLTYTKTITTAALRLVTAIN